jgi:NADPH:quinone reductase-like Zn-dependent oxidoreductase
MKAISVTKYGPPEVIHLTDAPMPEIKDGELLIRVKATVAAPPDCAFRKGEPYLARLFSGLTRPSGIPGDVLSGVVEEVGKGVTRFRVGDRVYGSSGTRMGTNAEFLALPEDAALSGMPEELSFKDAAAISEGSLTALPFLRDGGKIREGMKLLVIGASGGVGVYAVQLAKCFGASVTAVCGPNNLSLVRELGADEAIDYTRQDYTLAPEMYDVIFDAVGKSTFSKCRAALKPDGVYLSTVPTLGLMVRMAFTARSTGKKAAFMATGLRKPAEKRADLEFLSKLIQQETLKAVVDRVYPLTQMADAHRYVETGHKRGSVAVMI